MVVSGATDVPTIRQFNALKRMARQNDDIQKAARNVRQGHPTGPNHGIVDREDQKIDSLDNPNNTKGASRQYMVGTCWYYISGLLSEGTKVKNQGDTVRKISESLNGD